MEDSDFDKELLERDRRAREAAALNSYGDNSMEVKTSIGSIRAGGQVAVIILCIVMCCGFVAYMVRDHDLRNVERAQDIKANLKSVIDAQKRVEDSLDSAAYILTLSEAERRALKMDMPDSLRKKVGRDR